MFTLSSRQLKFAFLVLTLLPLGVRQSKADSRFLTPPVYPVGQGPTAVASADFNGDGKPDLVTANNNALSISVLLNNGNGAFLPAVNYSAGADLNPTSVAVADVNGDGKLDIAVSGEGCCGGQVVVFLGNGDGTFQPAVPYAIGGGGDQPGSVVIADASGDGKLDLIVPSMNPSFAVVSVLLGNGDGTFQAAKVTTLTVIGSARESMVAGDFNKDSKLDVALIIRGQLAVLLGKGNGTFQISAPFGSLMNSIATADINNDGALDLVTADTAGSVSVWPGNGNGTFQPAVTSAVSASGPAAITLADLNGDAKLDVIVGGPFPASVSVFFGNGTAQLGTPVAYAVGTGPAFSGGVSASDLNGDGFPDVVCTNNLDSTITVIFGSLTGALQSLPVSLAPSGPVAVGDFNHDGKLDVASSVSSLSQFGLWLGNGDATFQNPSNLPVGTGPLYITAADFNGDGAADVATSNVKDISVALGNGDGTFQPAVNYGSSFNIGNNSNSITSADLNGDGKPDLAAITTPRGGKPLIAILLNIGDGTFQPAVQYSNGAEGVAFADFNGDGILDMVSTLNQAPYPATVFLGNGDGTFQTPVNFSIKTPCPQVIAADVNGDRQQDLVLACGFLGVMLGNGDGTFQPPIFVATPTPAILQVAAGDLNGDGKIDVASAGLDLGVFYGNGDGTFNYVNYGLAALHVAIGNFNGDNAPDLTFSNGLGVLGLANTGGTSDVLKSSPNPSKVNQTVTFRAAIEITVKGSPGGMPTGSVTFKDGSRKLATVTLSNGIASFKTSQLSAGTHKIRAFYSGDTNFNPNVSRVVVQTVNP